MSERLTASADAKTDPRVEDRVWRGKRVPIGQTLNAFGLSSGIDASCPGATQVCQDSCYALNLEQRPAIGSKLQRNFDLLSACNTVGEMVDLLDPVIQGFNERADKKNLSRNERMFRIHWAGDFFSEEYAQAWAETIAKHQDIDFTAYTRTWPRTNTNGERIGPNVLPVLVGAELANLSLYMSVDSDNFHDAAPSYSQHHQGVRLAILGKYFGESYRIAQELKDRYDLPDFDPRDDRSVIMCPEENPYVKFGSGMLQLANIDRRDAKRRAELLEQGEKPKRKNPNFRGACVDCRACYGRRTKHILFAEKQQMGHQTGINEGQEEFDLGFTLRPEPVPVELVTPRVKKPRKNELASDINPTLF